MHNALYKILYLLIAYKQTQVNPGTAHVTGTYSVVYIRYHCYDGGGPRVVSSVYSVCIGLRVG